MKLRNYTLPMQLISNIHGEEVINFLRRYKLHSELANSGQDLYHYLNDVIKKGKIPLDEFNEFLFDALFYGYHKEARIYKIKDIDADITDEKVCLDCFQQRFDYVNDLDFNRLSRVFIGRDDDDSKIAAIKTYSVNSKINTIRIIFYTEMKYYPLGRRDTHPHETYAFIPVEIDLEKKLLITKAYRRYNVENEIYEYEYILEEYFEIIAQMFGIETSPYSEKHKLSLYRMCKNLVDNFYSRLLKQQMDHLAPDIKIFKEAILKKVHITDIEEKAVSNNIYDFEERITEILKNMILRNYFEENEERNLYSYGIKGSVTYIKFSDGTNVNAILKGFSSYNTIFYSQSFMGLHQTIDNTKRIKELTTVWYKEKKVLKVKYDASNADYLIMQFYTKLEEDDFYYALDRYLEFEKRPNRRAVPNVAGVKKLSST